jgi:hypothetical protein
LGAGRAHLAEEPVPSSPEHSRFAEWRLSFGKPVSTCPGHALKQPNEHRSADERVRAMSDQDLKAELERLRNENAALKKGASSGARMKVSEKGAVSIYGMGRFPVTLYKEQWLKLLDMSDEIRSFIAENESKLKAKD